MVKKMEWGQGFFDEEMCKTLFTDRIVEHAKKECNFIEDVLDIPKGSKILDVGCGIGRHAVELAKRGHKLTGLDYSSTFLKKGKIYAKKEGVDIKFIERDMRYLPFKEEFDAVINMCTSFGYFEEEKDHLEVLRGIAHALKPKGKFLLDTVNKEYLIRHFQKKDWDKINDIFVLKEKELDLEHNRINGKWVFIEGEKRKECFLSLHIFTLGELISLLNKAGFNINTHCGNYEKEPCSCDSNRIIILAEKKI